MLSWKVDIKFHIRFYPKKRGHLILTWIRHKCKDKVQKIQNCCLFNAFLYLQCLAQYRSIYYGDQMLLKRSMFAVEATKKQILLFCFWWQRDELVSKKALSFLYLPLLETSKISWGRAHAGYSYFLVPLFKKWP